MHSAEAEDSIVETIVIRSPAERIFAALTTPEQCIAWWGAPGRFQTTAMQTDLRPGGAWRMGGNGMGDKPFTICGEYREIVRPQLLVLTWRADWQENAPWTLVRWDLEERDGQTTVRLTHSGLDSDSRANHRGWPQILGWLKAFAETAADAGRRRT